ncbi:MAG: NUDIX domain-containing protein [Peptococcaceae bacterium]|nr:NUDIX domain-containing protein [Peptococcaceae bacterium]
MPNPDPYTYFQIGSLYKRKDIHDLFGGQRQGGISTPSRHPVIFLFSSKRGEEFGYQDGWKDDGLYYYTGEGQVGDMTFTRGNLAIKNHLKDGKDLFLFETEGDLRRFIGRMSFVGYEEVTIPDIKGNLRKGILFKLIPQDASIETEPLHPEKYEEPEKRSFHDLRQAAFNAIKEADGNVADSREAKARYYFRSNVIASYVRNRAYGFCEACGNFAPFKKANGELYLEPHHIRRRSDGGPDKPEYMIALCPNCHRKAHHGADKEEFNKTLLQKAHWIEESLFKGTLKYVTVAVTVDDEGRVLITKRPANKVLGDHWEFPGGKLEKGETLEECLKRELEEELNLSVSIERSFKLIDHDYGDFQIRLFSFICKLPTHEIQLNEHSSYVWVLPKELDKYHLAGADKKLAKVLKQKFFLEAGNPTRFE